MTTIFRSAFSFRSNMTRSWLSRLNRDMAASEARAISGARLLQGSDDPTAFAEAQDVRETMADHKLYQENARYAMTVHDVADAALVEASNLIVRARELAIAGASDTSNADDRAARANEIAGIKEGLLDIANSQLGDRFVFAGRAYDGRAFDAAGTYLGSDSDVTHRVGDQTVVRTGWVGSDIFQSGEDMFALLDEVEAALRANDGDATGALLGRIGDAHEELIGGREQVALDRTTAELHANLSERLEILMGERLDEYTAVDPIEAYTELANFQTAYESALQVASKASGTRLLDYL